MPPYACCLGLLLLTVLPACSVVKAPVDLATTTVSTTGKVACAACDATGAVANAAGKTASGVASVTRSAADVVTNPVAQELALESQGRSAKAVVKGLTK